MITDLKLVAIPGVYMVGHPNVIANYRYNGVLMYHPFYADAELISDDPDQVLISIVTKMLESKHARMEANVH